MANYKTGAQRYNDRLHKIFDEGRRLNAIHDKGRENHSKESHKGEYSSCATCHKATDSNDSKKKVASKMKETKKAYMKRHHDDLMKYETN